MKRKIFVLLLALTALINNACSIEDETPNFHFTALEIVSAEVPESFDFNETYVISVNYLKPDGCTFFEGFDVIKEDVTVRNVVAIGSVRTDIDACTQAIIEETATFNFTVIHSDPYIFNFYTGDDSNGDPKYLEVIVPVNMP